MGGFRPRRPKRGQTWRDPPASGLTLLDLFLFVFFEGRCRLCRIWKIRRLLAGLPVWGSTFRPLLFVQFLPLHRTGRLHFLDHHRLSPRDGFRGSICFIFEIVMSRPTVAGEDGFALHERMPGGAWADRRPWF